MHHQSFQTSYIPETQHQIVGGVPIAHRTTEFVRTQIPVTTQVQYTPPPPQFYQQQAQHLPLRHEEVDIRLLQQRTEALLRDNALLNQLLEKERLSKRTPAPNVELDIIHQKMHNLSMQNTSFANENADLRKKLESLNSELKTRGVEQSQYNSLENQLQNYLQENRRLNELVNSKLPLERQNRELHAKLERERRELSDIRSTMQSQINARGQRLHHLEQQLIDMAKTAEHQRRLYEDVQKEHLGCKNLKNEIETLRSQINTLEERLRQRETVTPKETFAETFVFPRETVSNIPIMSNSTVEAVPIQVEKEVSTLPTAIPIVLESIPVAKEEEFSRPARSRGTRAGKAAKIAVGGAEKQESIPIIKGKETKEAKGTFKEKKGVQASPTEKFEPASIGKV